MKLAACALVVVLAGCAADGADTSGGGGGSNPPTLWLAMGSGSVMKLVGEEPHPY